MKNSKFKNKTIIGLTGGIATGKSTVARIFESLGIKVIYLDKIAKQILEKGTKWHKEVTSNFTEAVVNGEIDRKKLREIIFNDTHKKSLLEKITHPLIMRQTKNEIANSNEKVIVIEAPLLFEAGFDCLTDFVICTVCDLDTQISRLTARDNIDKDLALKMINSQMNLNLKSQKSDFVIDTTAGVDEIRQEVFKMLTMNNLN